MYSDTMSIVLFWRCIGCSVKSLSPPFAFSPFSLLSSSSSSRLTNPLNIISDLLTKECGFSSSQVVTVMRRRRDLQRTKSEKTARETIHFLKDSGFTKKELKTTILKCPTILLLTVDRQLKPKMEFLKKMGFASQDLARIVSRSPRLLSSSLDKCIAPRTLQLETLFGSRVHMCKALKMVPELLTMDFEKQVIPKVEYLKDRIGIHQASTTFVRALSVFLHLSYESLGVKIKHMSSLGLAEEEIGQMLKTYPETLRLST